MERRKRLSDMEGHASRPLVIAANPGEILPVDELSRKMLSWSKVWFGSCEDRETTEAHLLVRERLLSWLRRCIGRQARGLLTDRGEDISLAASTPLLTAFLGRRAMRELSRRVLNDL